MYKNLTKACAALAVAGSLAFATPAFSQDTTRNYDQGSVWQVSYVTTKPGMFDAYLNNLSQVWRAYLEESKKDGDVLSYQILNVVSPRDGEPDLMLLVEYKNMAVFDRSLDYFDKQAEKLQGTLEAARMGTISREELRTLNGTVLTRELHFTDKK